MTTSPATSPVTSPPAVDAPPAADAAPLPRRRARVWAAVGLAVLVLAVALVVRAALAPTAGSAAGPGRGQAEVLDADVTTFGTPFVYEDGLEIEVGAPQAFTPSPLASGVDPASGTVLVEVTVTNGTDEPYRASTLAVEASSGGAEAGQVWDPQHAVELAGPAFAVPPGGTVSFRLGFAVREPDDLRLTVIPAIYGYAPLVVETV